MGGPSTSLIGTCVAQKNLGSNVKVITAKIDENNKNFQNINVKKISIFNLQNLLELKKQIQQADLIHFHSFFNLFIIVVIILSYTSKAKKIISPRGTVDKYNINTKKKLLKKIYYFLTICFIKKINAVHYQSINEFKNSDILNNYIKKKIIISNGSLLIKKKYKKPKIFKSSNINFVYFGRLNKIKNLEFQIKIISYLSRYKKNVKLFIIGPDDGEKKKLQNRVNNLNCNKNIHFMKPIYGKKKLEYLKNADFFFLTSWYECNSNFAAEVFSSGGCLLTLKSCNLNYMKQHNALKILSFKPAYASKQILELLKNKNEVNKIKKNAFNYAKNKLNWLELTKKMISFYKKI